MSATPRTFMAAAIGFDRLLQESEQIENELNLLKESPETQRVVHRELYDLVAAQRDTADAKIVSLKESKDEQRRIFSLAIVDYQDRNQELLTERDEAIKEIKRLKKLL